MSSYSADSKFSTRVRILGIIGLSGYLIAFVVLSIGILFVVWPGMPERSWLGSVSDEGRYIMIAVAGGVLGSVIHALTSLADYVGNRRLVSSWGLWYISRVFIGAAMAVVFYMIIRGGFIAPSADVRVINPFSIVTLTALVGMFSKSALDKINMVADVLFRGEKPLQTGIDQISAALGVSTPDNYKGFLCLSFEDEKSEPINFDETNTLVLDAERLYDLVLWFQPERPSKGAAEEINLSGGLESAQTEFSVAPNSDSFTLRPHNALISLDVKKPSRKEKFKFKTPEKADPYELWVEVSQKNRLVYVASLTFLVRYGKSKSPLSL